MSVIEKAIHYKLIEYIHTEVEEGRLVKGDKIPSERTLVNILGIGRNSIREALKILDILGIVDRRQGDGSYIHDNFDSWFSKPMSVAIMLSETSKNEVFEFRNMIEVEIARLAAERITNGEIEDLKACYEKLSSSKNETESTSYDKSFHSILAKASKNIIIINSYNAMDYMLDLFIYDIRVAVFNNEGRDLARRVHDDLYAAVINRNPVMASEAMKKHMDVIRRYYR